MMDRANYKKVLKILDRDRVYNYYIGMCMDYVNRARIDVDNTSGKATEVLEQIISYVDAMLYDVDKNEPSSVSDKFAFILDGERYTLDVEYMALDADDEDWNFWQQLRSSILNAKQLRVDYHYVSDADESEDLINIGIKRMLDDVLADGCYADCVSFCIQIEMSGGGFEEDDGLESHYRRYLWLNGLHNGQYVCGEIPFEANEQLIRSTSGWRQSSGTSDESGLFLRLHPNTSPALLSRLRKAAKDFSHKVNCLMEIGLSMEDHKRIYMEMNSNYVTASMTDKSVDDKEQLNFPDLRTYFTTDEVQSLLNRYPNLSSLYIKHADPKYSEDELERVRFLWTLALMRELEGPNRSLQEGNGCTSRCLPPTEDYLNVFYKLPEEIRLKLYGTRDYERSVNPLDGRQEFRATDYNIKQTFVDTHSGLGDLSLMDDICRSIVLADGYYIRLHMAYLSGIEDVRTMCDFLNELKKIEQLAQAETGAPVFDANDDSLPNYTNSAWYLFSLTEEEASLTGSALEKVEKIPHMTIREFYEQTSNITVKNMNKLQANNTDYSDDDITFESDDSNNWARLRFRLENGKYIYEIAQAEI